MRTVTVEVPEGHMVKIVKEESMQPTQKVTGAPTWWTWRKPLNGCSTSR